MRIPYGFNLVNNGVLEVKESEAINIRMIFDYYLAGASLGKVVDMLYAKQLLPRPEKKNGLVRPLRKPLRKASLISTASCRTACTRVILTSWLLLRRKMKRHR